jgi:hypothetical protein
MNKNQLTAIAWKVAHLAIDKQRKQTSDDMRELLGKPDLTDEDTFEIYDELEAIALEVWKTYLEKSRQAIVR